MLAHLFNLKHHLFYQGKLIFGTADCPFTKKDSKCPFLKRGKGCTIGAKAIAAGCPLFAKDINCSFLKKNPGCPFLSKVCVYCLSDKSIQLGPQNLSFGEVAVIGLVLEVLAALLKKLQLNSRRIYLNHSSRSFWYVNVIAIQLFLIVTPFLRSFPPI